MKPLFWLLLLASFFHLSTQFTCNPTCPDNGYSSASCGGNVTIRVKSATGLRDTDGFGANAYLPDPFVEFSVQGIVTSYSPIESNTLNPKWNTDVSLGILGCKSTIKVTIWDADSGLEGTDDKLAQGSVKVPFCTMLSASNDTVSCNSPFNCKADDSLWENPYRYRCYEEGTLSLSNGVSLTLAFSIIPLTLETPLSLEPYIKDSDVDYGLAGVPSGSYDGRLYVEAGLEFDTLPTDLKGALQLKLHDTKYVSDDAFYLYVAANFPSYFLVCRTDNNNDAGHPGWLSSWDASYLPLYAFSTSSSATFGCFRKGFSGTARNRWGGVESGAILLKSNTASGVSSYDFMYTVLVLPARDVTSTTDWSIRFSYLPFLSLAFIFGIPLSLFLWWDVKLLKKVNWRIDRVESYLVQQVFTGKEKSLLATLFLDFGQSPSNVVFRSHLYYAKLAIYLCLLTPFVILWSWGVSTISEVEPPALGFGIIFMGTAALLFSYAFQLWREQAWRVSMLTLIPFLLSLTCSLCFLVSVVFADPSVWDGGEVLDFTALSFVFGTLNAIPLILLAFEQDSSFKANVRKLLEMLTEAILTKAQKEKDMEQGHGSQPVSMPQRTEDEVKANKKVLPMSTAFHKLLDNAYTIHQKLPIFRFSEVLSVSMGSTNLASTPRKEGSRSWFPFKLGFNSKLYPMSLFFLFIYIIIAFRRTDHGPLAFLHSLALLLLDSVHEGISHGKRDWPPGFAIFLLMSGRIAVMSGGISYWMIGYSIAYLVYGLALVNEIVTLKLPKLSKQEASKLLFLGKDTDIKPSPDMAGNPDFLLGTLSFAFLATVMVSTYAKPTSLPMPDVFIGDYVWPVYVFGIISFFVVVIGGLLTATSRAFYLQKNDLLSGWSVEAHLFLRSFKLPYVLAFFTQFAMITAGFLLYGATSNTFILVSSFYVPAILGLLTYAKDVWVSQDYVLVVWPPEENIEHAIDDVPTDLDLAFNVMGDMFGEKEDKEEEYGMNRNMEEGNIGSSSLSTKEDGRQEKNNSSSSSFRESGNKYGIENGNTKRMASHFELPPLKKTGEGEEIELKMPPLPLKSVLKKKRQEAMASQKDRPASQRILSSHFSPTKGSSSHQDGSSDPFMDMLSNENDVWNQLDLQEVTLEEVNEEEEEAVAMQERRNSDGSQPLGKVNVQPMSVAERRMQRGLVGALSWQSIRIWLMQRGWGLFLVQNIEALLRTCGLGKAKYAKVDGYGEEEEEEEEGDEEDGKEKKKKNKPKDTEDTTNLSDDENSQVDYDEEDDDDDDGFVDFRSLGFWSAMIKGYLLFDEYLVLAAWFGSILLIVLYGVTLSLVQTPSSLGHLLWGILLLLLFTIVPMIKYFNTFTFDQTIREFLVVGSLFLFFFCLFFFLSALEADLSSTHSLWVLDTFLFYPILVSVTFKVLSWMDNGYRVVELDEDKDGDVTFKEIIKFFGTLPFYTFVGILWVWQMYTWAGTDSGSAFLFLFFVSLASFVLVRDWAKNNFYLSPTYQEYADKAMVLTMIISSIIALFSPKPIFALSVFFLTHIVRKLAKVFSFWVSLSKDSLFYFSPFLLPAYVYDARTHDIVDMTDTVLHLFSAIAGGLLWGVSMAVFIYPVSFGVSSASIFIMTIGIVVAKCITHVPLTLGKAAGLLDPSSILEAAETASAKFEDRALPFQVRCEHFHDYGQEIEQLQKEREKMIILKEEEEKEKGEDQRREEKEQEERRKQEAKRKVRWGSLTLVELAMEQIGKTRSLRYAKDIAYSMQEAKERELQEVKERLERVGKGARGLSSSSNALSRNKNDVSLMDRFFNLFSLLPPSQTKGYAVHNQALYTSSDALAETLIVGRGAFGFLGMGGFWYSLFQRAKGKPYLSFLQQPWLNAYDKEGNKKKAVQLPDVVDSREALKELVSIDHFVNIRFKEEFRSAIHLTMLLMVSVEAKLLREKILFQKFFRENRFRLMSNGIKTPSNIFSSSSYASIDIPLVTVWLNTLSEEERERFHLLKQNFSTEQRERDALIDYEDSQKEMEADQLLEEQKARDQQMSAKLYEEVKRLQYQKVQQFVETLNVADATRFSQVQKWWLTDPHVHVHPMDQELYDQFKERVLGDGDELLNYAKQKIVDIEGGGQDCRMGRFGRAYQFVDSDFPPDSQSFGTLPCSSNITEWRPSVGVNAEAQLFEGGSDPDDVEQGYIEDGWLLSAISMLAAAGGLGNVNDQIQQLFVPHETPDGEETCESDVGVYGLRLFRYGQWYPIIVDDHLPVLSDDLWTNTNRGVAVAHSKECSEMWVSLIEKAFAKYFGSYAALRHGYVHHALHTLTGSETEEVFLSKVSRGPKKKALWDQLIRYKRNGYVLGASSISSGVADQDILDSGIVFGAAYPIYDVRSVDGHQLIQLRNPPGDHEEWKGDWSDKSSLWTLRMKAKLGWVDNEEDNTFWISFDDFCNVFRSLYVCRWYDPDQWQTYHLYSAWESSLTQEWEKSYVTSDTKEKEEGQELTEEEEDILNRPKNVKVDTCPGLPHDYNEDCKVENNPQFSLRITRPTDLRITLTQADSRGISSPQLHPVAFYLMKATNEKRPNRIKELTKENILLSSGDARALRTQHMYVSLGPGLYTILCGTFLPEMEGPFTLTFLSNYPIRADRIWPPRYGASLEDDLDYQTDLLAAKMLIKVRNCVDWVKEKIEGDDEEESDDEGAEIER